MDSERDEADMRDGEKRDDTAGSVGVGSGGLLASTFGALGGPTLGGVVASDAVDYDPTQDDQLNLDALASYGSNKGETGDDGVSPAQKEVEADELNG